MYSVHVSISLQKIADLTEAIEECNTAIVEPEKKLQTAKQIHGECKLLDIYTHEMATITKNVSNKPSVHYVSITLHN